MNGTLYHQMRYELSPYVHQQRVMDLGSGNGVLANILLEVGAQSIIAVDKEDSGLKNTPQITFMHRGFDEVPLSTVPSVVFLSWPSNHFLPGLVPLVERAEVVIYLGSNANGNACGFRELFEHFLTRRLLLHLPRERNTLLVLGQPAKTIRTPTQEELGAIDQSQVYKFDSEEETHAWVTSYCKQENLVWDELTAGERFLVLRSVPCNIRCARVGEPVFLRHGEKCSECGKRRPHKTAWEHLRETCSSTE